LLATVGAATKLPFEITREIPADPKVPGSRPQTKVDKATVAEIQKDYQTVQKLSPGFLTRAYAKFTKVRLPQATIDSLLTTELDDVVSQVRSKCPKFDTWPLSAQETVVEMAFNMGPSFFATWPKFTKAIENQDWETASKECRSGDIQKDRNDWRKKQFEDAAA